MKKNSDSKAAAPAKEKSSKTNQPPVTTVDNLKIEHIRLSNLNPRKTFNEEALKELAISISEQGLLQPITVRPIPDLLDSKLNQIYEVVCGARRYKAMNLNGAKTIPCIIRELSDAEALDAMITENLQRKDVDPIEEAEAYKILTDQGQTIADLSVRFGKSEKYIKGRLSLSNLTDKLKECLTNNTLTIGAAVNLAKLTDEQQQEFVQDYIDDDPNNTESISIADVEDYIDCQTTSLTGVSFLDDNDQEPWNDIINRHCTGCPFNSASQGALFPDMVKGKSCSDSACYNNKILAYAQWFIAFHTCNLLPKNQEPDTNHFYLSAESYFWHNDKKIEAAYKETLGKLKANYYFISSAMRRYYPKDGQKMPDDVIKCIALDDLFRGHNPWIYYYLPKHIQPDTKIKTPWDIANSLTNLREKRTLDMIKLLEPKFNDTFDKHMQLLKDQLDNMTIPESLLYSIAFLIGQCLSYQITKETIVTCDKQHIKDWLSKHSLGELISIYIRDTANNGNNSNRGEIMEDVLLILEPEETTATIASYESKFKTKEAKYIQQLKDMGCDEHGREIKKSESK